MRRAIDIIIILGLLVFILYFGIPWAMREPILCDGKPCVEG